MSRHQLGRLLGLSLALCVPLVACGADNDILPPAPPAPPAPASTGTPTDTNTQTGDDLSNTDHLTSNDTSADAGAACVASACTVPAGQTACCTTEADVTGNHALEAGKCGADLSAFGAGCAQLNQPGVLDTACPQVTIPPGPPLDGCCTASGHCGAMDAYFPLGCSSNPDSTTWVACGAH